MLVPFSHSRQNQRNLCELLSAQEEKLAKASIGHASAPSVTQEPATNEAASTLDNIEIQSTFQTTHCEIEFTVHKGTTFFTPIPTDPKISQHITTYSNISQGIPTYPKVPYPIQADRTTTIPHIPAHPTSSAIVDFKITHISRHILYIYPYHNITHPHRRF